MIWNAEPNNPLPVITDEALMRLRSEPRTSAKPNFDFNLVRGRGAAANLRGARGACQSHKLVRVGASPTPATTVQHEEAA